MSGALGDDSDPTFTHFAHRSEFLDLLKRFLDLDLRRDPDQREDEEEVRLLDQLGAILDYYLPLPGLLDPSLHEIVPPLMEVLTVALNSLISDAPEEHISAARLQRLGRVIQWVVKVRGWKAIVTYLPSSISNLPTLIRLLSPPNTPSTSSSPLTPHHPSLSGQEAWEVRAILLLWLSILLTVPFDLSALSTPSFTLEELASLYPSFDKVSIGILFRQDVSEITAQVILLSLPLLHNPGKEATYAALVLARLYSRSDAVIYLESFFEWARMELEEGDRENEAHFVSALFEFLAILPGLLAPEHLGRLEWFTTDVLLPHLKGSRTAAGSGLVRKLAVKARGRWWVAKLGHTVHKGDEDVDMPEGLEEELDDLMNGLSDKDTIVRYSCAKYLARLSSVLPSSLAEQIMLATIALFGGTKDEPVISTDFGVVVDPGGTASTGGTMGFGGAETTRGEARWHGCCLAIAEMARRGLITDTEAISQAVDWVLKAMTFDLRRSSYSIGANVRDAAAYLVWSLSRACPAATLEPHVNELATALTCVACFDREVGVRRAASAAFQEGVGRLGLYPDGIDVLGKTDFYSVSVRRIAFKTAAPAVARHDVYRRRMREHLHQITLRHWDVTMRNLAANALKDVLTLASDQDIQDSIDREIKQIPSLDPVNVHGALVALSAMCQLLNENDERRKKVLHSVSAIRPAALVSTQGAEIVQAACDLITASISLINIDQPILNDLVHHNLDLAMKRRESDCYEAAARMIGRVSELKPANREVERLLQMMTSPRAVPKQIAALALGHVKYAGCPDKLDVAVKALLAQGDVATNADVETRRYAIRSLARILAQRYGDETLVSNDQFAMAYDFFSRALDDYSTDQRGDVGSWIRVAGLLALGQAISIASQNAEPKFWVSQDMLETALRGIIKLGMEKLEPVRAAAWRSWGLLRTCRADQTWEWIGKEVWFFDVKDESDESFRYIELRSWYTSAMPLLVTQYRAALISGIANSIGSQVESVASVALDSLKAYLITQAEGSLITAISKDLQKIISAGVNQNRIFIPTTMTITKLVADDKLCQSLRGQTAAPIGSIVMTACRGIPQLKSIERITVSMKLVVTCLGVFETTVQSKAIDNIALFLGHRFPRIRAMTSEALYLKLSEIHDDELDPQLENLLLETEWTDESVGMSEAEEVVRLLRGMRDE